MKAHINGIYNRGILLLWDHLIQLYKQKWLLWKLQYINNKKHNLEQCPISPNRTPRRNRTEAPMETLDGFPSLFN
jgi:hypothetical protein